MGNDGKKARLDRTKFSTLHSTVAIPVFSNLLVFSRSIKGGDCLESVKNNPAIW